MAVPFWTRGDLNAFFGLGINMLVNVLVLAGLCVGVVHMAPDDVYQVVLPALGIELLIGNLFYFYLARQLAMKEQRDGRHGDAVRAERPAHVHRDAGDHAADLPGHQGPGRRPGRRASRGPSSSACIILIGAFVGPSIRQLHAARGDARHARRHLAHVHLDAARRADVGRAVDRAAGLHDHHRRLHRGRAAAGQLPGRPGGAAASARRSAGSAASWSPPRSATRRKAIAVGIPSLNIDLLLDGLSGISPLLATAIPLGIYNFTEAMSNVESAAAAGDNYNLRHVLLADGTGAVVGAALGSPFPPAVYIGQPGWKAAGGRISYSLATGVLIFLLCVFGLFPLLGGAAADPGDRPGAAVHRPRDRLAGVRARCRRRTTRRSCWRRSRRSRSGARAWSTTRCWPRARASDKVGVRRAGQRRRALRRAARRSAPGSVLVGHDPRLDRGLPDRPPLHPRGAPRACVGGVLTLVGLIHGRGGARLLESRRSRSATALAAVVCLAYARLRLPPRELDLSTRSTSRSRPRPAMALRARGGAGGRPGVRVGG